MRVLSLPLTYRAVAIAVMSLFDARLHAQTVAASKTSEQISGELKRCYYEGAGRDFVRNVKFNDLCPNYIRVPTRSATFSSAPQAVATKIRESTVGSTKVCVYDFVGREYTRSVDYDKRCPSSIRVR
jgi:hypothetical protein